jgi:hypothetical protein
MTPEQLRAHRRALMDRGDHPGVCLCNRALAPDVTPTDLRELVATINAHEDLRERVLREES